MDTAVVLVQAYLNVNGYFTVAEYPVMESFEADRVRTATDIDVLAFRFPGAGCEAPARSKKRTFGDMAYEPDRTLATPKDRADMIVAEVKEGPAQFNPASRDPVVLAAALARFGCCAATDAQRIVHKLLKQGRTVTPSGHALRLVAFGSSSSTSTSSRPLVISMHHVVDFLQRHLRDHWGHLGHTQLKQPAMSFLALLEKARRGDRTLRRRKAQHEEGR